MQREHAKKFIADIKAHCTGTHKPVRNAHNVVCHKAALSHTHTHTSTAKKAE